MSSKSCIFCEMIAGQLKASIVYEDEDILAIMDRRQANPGHVLVIPKQHFPNIYALSEEAGFAVMRCLIAISRAVKQAFGMEGLNIWQSNGASGGQEVPHVHFHIHPRRAGDGLLRVYSSSPAHPTREELDDYARRIRDCL
jgi:histidine triad (HIT) family protein